MVAWNYGDDFFVDNISATKINRQALEKIIKLFKHYDGYAGLQIWEFIAKMMPDWRVEVVDVWCSRVVWTNDEVGTAQA
jgi:hypothetical protein